MDSRNRSWRGRGGRGRNWRRSASWLFQSVSSSFASGYLIPCCNAFSTRLPFFASRFFSPVLFSDTIRAVFNALSCLNGSKDFVLIKILCEQDTIPTWSWRGRGERGRTWIWSASALTRASGSRSLRTRHGWTNKTVTAIYTTINITHKTVTTHTRQSRPHSRQSRHTQDSRGQFTIASNSSWLDATTGVVSTPAIYII